MQTIKDDSNQNRLTSNLFHRLFWNLVLPISLVVIGLIIEYWSGLFQQPAQSTRTPSSYYYWVFFIAVTLVATALFAKDCLIIWLRQHRYVREEFALLTLCTVTSLTSALIASLITGFMPWSIPSALIQAFINKSTLSLDTQWTDYGLLIVLYIMFIRILNRQHQNWHGLKSTEQYRREQRSETINFFAEGLNELQRLVRRAPPLEPYSESILKQFVPQLEPVTDLLVWKDQAKELIRLSSSSYVFDPSLDWHDKENCWVGRNVNTGDLVFLYPCQEGINEVEIDQLLNHVYRIVESENKKVGEIIVATKNGINKKREIWKDIPFRYETEASLLDYLIDFKDYFNEIRRRVLINRLPDSELTLNDVYVPSSFFLPNDAKQNSSIEEYLHDWLIEPSQRQLALLGEYGQGKSTAALLWAYHLITEQSKLSGRIPLLIELRGTSPRNLTPLQLLGAWAAQYNINPQALMRLLIAGRLILIFEGFDEMALVGDAEMRLKHFRTLWQFAYPKAKILITGRPNFFLDEEERKAALGISKPLGDRPYCEALRLAAFSPKQIREAMRAYKSTLRDQIHALVEKNSRFRELVSRPSLLHIVAVLWERERLFEKVDQLTSAYVMDLFIRFTTVHFFSTKC